MKKLLGTILMLFALNSYAWEPNKPVTVIVGNTPGAGNEIAFRKLADIVQKTHNFTYVMQHIPGADSVIANNKFLEANPDGYTINLPSHMSSYVTNDIWEKKIKKYTHESFIDVLTMGKSPLVLVVNQKSSINTPAEFASLVRNTTKPINVAIGGGAHRTAFEYLMESAHGNKSMVKSIKFNGPAPAVQSVAQFDGTLGTEFGIMPIAVAKSMIDAGKVKPIGFTGSKKMPQFPSVPLLNSIAPGINVYAAWSLELPNNTPVDVIDWYQKAFSAAIKSKEYADWCRENVIFYEEDELTPAGLKRHILELRSTFLPVLNKIDISKE